MPILTNPPNPDCAEISLFGPGIGECVVLHVGNGEWYIVDSCLDADTGEPVSLVYLKKLGVDIANNVKGIFLTHWHQDHIAGASALVKECKSAKIFISSALISKEMFELVRLYKPDPFAATDKYIEEFRNIVDYLKEAKQTPRIKIVGASHTFFDHSLNFRKRLVALSPSNAATVQSISNAYEHVPSVDSQRTRNVIRQEPNLNAIALHFTFGDKAVVLGSDLEKTTNVNTGWDAVFTEDLVVGLGLEKADIIKISHHGSPNGHHDSICADLLKHSPLSVATTYASSSLPSSSDIARIVSTSSKLLITTDPNSSKKAKKDAGVERELKAIAISRKTINDKMGHIQIRFSSAGHVLVEKSDSVVELV